MIAFPGLDATAVLLAAGWERGWERGWDSGPKQRCRSEAEPGGSARGCSARRRLSGSDLGRNTVVLNPGWQSGMGGSFRLGVEAARPATTCSWRSWTS